VTVYPANANGNVSPYRTITGNATGLTQPGGVVLDRLGKIYIANYSVSSSALLVFAATANGNVGPLRSIAGYKSGLFEIDGVALDTRHNIYTNGVDPFENVASEILIYRPRAHGDAAPIRTIRGSKTRMIGTGGIAIDSVGNTYVTNFRVCAPHCRGRNGLLVFAPDANGNVAPIRMIVGSKTMLSKEEGIGGIAVDDSGDMYVRSGNSVLVYAADANGNIAPIQNISGSKTGLTGGGNGDVAVDSQRNIYVTNPFNNTVTVFDAGATGNVAPIQTISGYNTGLVSPEGITIH
jgi:hypothetical protein